MKLSEEFNPYNVKHVRAWKHLEEYGCWPDEFIKWMNDNQVVLDNDWFITMIYKMADAWTNHIIKEFEDA